MHLHMFLSPQGNGTGSSKNKIQKYNLKIKKKKKEHQTENGCASCTHERFSESWNLTVPPPRRRYATLPYKEKKKSVSWLN